MMKCVSVCVSRKIITSHFRAERRRREVSRLQAGFGLVIMMITMTIMMTLMLTMNDADVDGDDIKANHVQHLSPVLLWNPRHKQQSCA